MLNDMKECKFLTIKLHADWIKTRKGLPIKDVCSQGARGCPVRTFCRQGGSSDADVRTFWGKTFGFFEIYGMSAQTKELRVNFSRFCADVLYGRPLIIK